MLYAGVAGATRENGVIFRNVKVEKGSKATDWTPAPEDIDTQINGLDGRISTAESTITQQAGLIESKVSRDTYTVDKIPYKLTLTAGQNKQTSIQQIAT
ncbi:hypothetical protein CIB87_00010 [Priestia megaterium]|uniref:Uncharacterized protein n=1 Tax=Priestia megaterium TaxID=1404 RepID=A0AA86IAF3_PRIMG|nr:hypothetical protein [Priestia megaterium]AXI32679.1 hypothetical protein CIB87_00010 [Priestia megaterium]